MAKIKRVFEVAKELGVASKVIVAKCQAEDVPGITNHMSMVKIGLAATIKQWFGGVSSVTATATATATAVETAEKVDLTKARKARRRRTGEPQTQIETIPVEQAKATAVVETAALPVKVETEAPAGKPKSKLPPPLEESPVEGQPQPESIDQLQEVPPSAPAPDAVDPHPVQITNIPPVAEKRRLARPNVPDRPNVVKPAGAQLDKPKEAQLKGPRVLRIEQPDQVRPPRPRQTNDRGASPNVAPESRDEPDIARSRGPARGRGAGEEKDQSPARNKRRTLSTRRGRSADALPTGPSKFSQADIEELDARLKGATGYLKQRRRDLRKREQVPHLVTSAAVAGGKVEIAEPITIKDLSAATGIKSSDLIKYLFQKGTMATINSAIDGETAMEVCLEYNIELEVRERQTVEQRVVEEFELREAVDERRRGPVVTVLGHVDHGKTTLLDRIRSSDVASSEAGGITQHMGASRVEIKSADQEDKTVVFLDTPGHEAFTSMRARGASMTDVVVLVVAADDGVMPQTVESINHARAAGVPMIVALNKIDTPQATETNIRKIYGQLSEQGLNPVEWGGQTEVMKVSATEGTGITELLEMLVYQADLLELSADHGGSARGVVFESEMKEGRGPVARVLVQQGQLNVGDCVVAGRAFGRVRDMTDDRGKPFSHAGPATPVEFSGIGMVPDAGDKFYVTDTFQKAEDIASQTRERERHILLASKTKVSLENFAEQLKIGQTKEMRVVLKADAQGSLDVLSQSLGSLGNEEVTVRTLHTAVGGVTESDVLLADASDAVVIGFQIVAPVHVRDIAEQRRVEIRTYPIIYELIDDVKKALEGLLEPETLEEAIGEAEIRQVFRVSKMGVVAGCLVTEGVVQRGIQSRVIRDDVVVTEGRQIENLRRVKDDVREVRVGTECGIRIAGFDDIKPGDRLLCYKTVKVKRTLG